MEQLLASKQQQNTNFGQRWHLGTSSSCGEHGRKTFLWGQPPDFVFVGQIRNNLLEPGSSSSQVITNPSNEGTNLKSHTQLPRELTRPPWEDSSEEEKDDMKGRGNETEPWNLDNGWEEGEEKAVASPLSFAPKSEMRNSATTSVEFDRSKDSANRGTQQQPFYGRRRRHTNAYEKITFHSANSGLTILLPKGHPDLPAACRIAAETFSHGYSADNASKALDRFVKRNVLCVERTQCLAREVSAAWNSTVHIFRKFITVHSIGVKNAKFEGQGATVKEALDNCDLAILFELFDFDVVKEANVEINNRQRKNLLDTARKLDLKTQAWLDCSTEKFAKKIRELSERKELFY